MKNIVVLTGAGISAESGISTFRDSNGLWENYRIEDVANYDSFEKDEEIVTQNVDDLHERAGSKHIIHLHGELTKACSRYDKDEVYEIGYHDITPFDKDKRGMMLRPFIVWFGEPVPEIERAIKVCEKADILIVIGTSLVVYPAAGLMNYTKQGCKKYLIDPNKPDANLNGINFVQQKASIGVKTVVEELLND